MLRAHAVAGAEEAIMDGLATEVIEFQSALLWVRKFLAIVECWVSGSRRGERNGSYGGVGGEASTALLADERHGVLSPVWLQVGRPARSLVVVAESRGAGE